MTEFLGVIGSIIALITAAFAIRKYLFPSKVAESESLTKARADFDYYHKQWLDTGFSSKHKYLIPWDIFKEIGRHRKIFLSESDENERVFLFVCAVKHGLWADWGYETPKPQKVIAGLVTLLDGQAGWRPVWRAAYLIQRLLADNGTDLMEYIPHDQRDNKSVQEAIRAIGDGSVIPYLEDVTQGKNSHLRDKAFTILEDIKAYHNEEVELKYPDPDLT